MLQWSRTLGSEISSPTLKNNWNLLYLLLLRWEIFRPDGRHDDSILLVPTTKKESVLLSVTLFPFSFFLFKTLWHHTVTLHLLPSLNLWRSSLSFLKVYLSVSWQTRTEDGRTCDISSKMVRSHVFRNVYTGVLKVVEPLRPSFFIHGEKIDDTFSNHFFQNVYGQTLEVLVAFVS